MQKVTKTQNNKDYIVKRDFKYNGETYRKGEKIKISDKNLEKLFIKNNYIK